MQRRRRRPEAAFNASNGYVHYQRDANADTFVLSQSSYGGYGNAPSRARTATPDGQLVLNADGTPEDRRAPPARHGDDHHAALPLPLRRPLADDRHPDLARRRQRPTAPTSSTAGRRARSPRTRARETPCCGYEEEDTNWGGSSHAARRAVGPVRAIRETWGADSGTNVIRRETFYRDEMRQKTWLRVHVIPPLDGIYAQWDFNAGARRRASTTRATRTASPSTAERRGRRQLRRPVQRRAGTPTTPAQLDQAYRSTYKQAGLCTRRRSSDQEHAVDRPGDPTFADANAALGWTRGRGPVRHDRRPHPRRQATDLTPGGAAQSVVAVPYYRDDSCFDDGTGTDPGPKLHLRSDDEPTTAADGTPRALLEAGRRRLPTGDATTSSRATSAPTACTSCSWPTPTTPARRCRSTEIVCRAADLVMLPGPTRRPGNVGEQYGRELREAAGRRRLRRA